MSVKWEEEIMCYVERDGKQIAWTYQDEMLDLLDKLENYEAQHGVYSAPRELVRELRGLVKRCDILHKET